MTNITRATEAYWAQKANAKARGKDWKFTLEEWISWWEEKLGPNWLEKRGRGKSKYVMGRRGDTGPYSPENVECLTNLQNCEARRLNGSAAKGERSSQSVLTDKQAKEIYLATDKLKNLAQRYSVGITAIESIKRGRTWKHVTTSLGQAHKNKVGRPRKDKISRLRKKRKIGIPFYTTESEKEALF